MKIIVTASTKGGVGKSTLSACLAVKAAKTGNQVFLIDLDPQQSTASWWERAYGLANPMLVTGVDNVSRAIEMIQHRGVDRDYLIVDTPGSMMPIIADALICADAIAVIVQPSPKDIEAQGAVEGLMMKLGRTDRNLYVLNRCDKRSSLPFEAFTTVGRRSTYPPLMIGERVAYVRADLQGKTAPEIDRDADEEITALWTILKGIADEQKKDAGKGIRPVGRDAGHNRGSAKAGGGAARRARR